MLSLIKNLHSAQEEHSVVILQAVLANNIGRNSPRRAITQGFCFSLLLTCINQLILSLRVLKGDMLYLVYSIVKQCIKPCDIFIARQILFCGLKKVVAQSRARVNFEQQILALLLFFIKLSTCHATNL